jgi:hypothetical protein
MSSERLDSSSAAIPQQDIVLEFALSHTMNYREATRLDLVNFYSAKISNALVREIFQNKTFQSEYEKLSGWK